MGPPAISRLAKKMLLKTPFNSSHSAFYLTLINIQLPYFQCFRHIVLFVTLDPVCLTIGCVFMAGGMYFSASLGWDMFIEGMSRFDAVLRSMQRLRVTFHAGFFRSTPSRFTACESNFPFLRASHTISFIPRFCSSSPAIFPPALSPLFSRHTFTSTLHPKPIFTFLVCLLSFAPSGSSGCVCSRSLLCREESRVSTPCQLRKELIGPEIEDPVLPLADPSDIMGRRLFGDSYGVDGPASDR